MLFKMMTLTTIYIKVEVIGEVTRNVNNYQINKSQIDWYTSHKM